MFAFENVQQVSRATSKQQRYLNQTRQVLCIIDGYSHSLIDPELFQYCH